MGRRACAGLFIGRGSFFDTFSTRSMRALKRANVRRPLSPIAEDSVLLSDGDGVEEERSERPTRHTQQKLEANQSAMQRTLRRFMFKRTEVNIIWFYETYYD